MKINNTHKLKVEQLNYEYLFTYNRYDTLIDSNKIVGVDIDTKCKYSYMRVKCRYCESEADVRVSSFLNTGNKPKCCCNKYENSFAYHIQVELGESLSKYWDWDKNTVNPYCISKCSNKRVWIKCAKKEYHDSYEISCLNFTYGRRCPYCDGKRVHRKDSIMQWAIDNIDKDFEEKYISHKNIYNLWTLSLNSRKTIWIKCQNTDYHEDYKITCVDFHRGIRCPYCSHKSGKVHPKDSFAQYHIDNTDPNFLEKYWSDKNTLDPWKLAPSSHAKIYIKCNDISYHEDYKITAGKFYKGAGCPYCAKTKVHPKDSLAQWMIDNLGEHSIELYWGKSNKKSPWEYSPNSSKYIYINCPNHDEYKIVVNGYTKLNNPQKCKKCNSFAQVNIDIMGEDIFYKYWNKDNNINPFEIGAYSNENVLINCLETDYHDVYKTSCRNFMAGNRCPQCSHKGNSIHSLDSYASLYPEKAKHWNYEKNDKSPFEVAPHGSDAYWHICEKCGKSFQRSLSNLNRDDNGVVCKECNSSSGETKVIRYLDSNGYINNKDYFHDKSYFKDLIGLGGGILRPDFILPKEKIWIEFNGYQHEKWIQGWVTKEEFLKQQEHDRMKQTYAKKHDWKLIIIKESEKDYIEQILDNLLGGVNNETV